MEDYEIIYDYCSEDGFEERNITENFTGTHLELMDYIKQMRENGCYNITATALSM